MNRTAVTVFFPDWILGFTSCNLESNAAFMVPCGNLQFVTMPFSTLGKNMEALCVNLKKKNNLKISYLLFITFG